ncbi:MAG: carboxypeptidase regulatory-like domain-containing protein [Flavobacteriaceae bacterium]|nr:carboxypeptidase regulatory-like domain-containing protein [Flavobacteriaceae bacterium]MCY4217184.1 carboxypeptidase regulatory-like domain-containing protein [Flavobacteriaceae bacterium]MCY4254360.1 carboxypeptidase regulatory-like domain-containing protein [Flavobacteriaceae bacterium]
MRFVNILVLFAIFSWPHDVASQWSISGVVTNEEGKPISFCQVTIKKSSDSSEIMDYTFTDAEGKYELNVEVSGDLHIQFSKLHFHSVSEVLSSDTSDKKIEFNVSLKLNPQKLKDVTLEGAQPVIVKKDTVVYRAEHFRRGDEQVLEDLLENLPGVEVTSDGTVKFEGKEVEKIMIEGSDLVGDDYKRLSQNMPDYPIEEVELYRNYQENHLLRGLNDSGDFALNVLLEEQYKSVWFGNVKPKTDFDIDSKYQFAGNLIGVFKKNQSLITTEMNNIGRRSNGHNFTLPDIDLQMELLRPIINIGSFYSRFGNSNFNNQESISLNSVFNPNKKMEARVQLLFHWDEQSFFSASNRNVEINQIAFENNETYSLKRDTKRWTISSKVKYQLSKDQLLEYRGSYKDNERISGVSFDFNDINSLEALSTNEHLLTQKVDYTLRITNKQALQVKGNYAYQHQPQEYSSNQNFFEELSESTSMSRYNQNIHHRLDYATANIRYTQQMSKGNLWNIGLQTNYRKESLDAPTDIILDSEWNDFIDNNKYSIFESQAMISRQMAFNNIKITPRINFSTVNTSLKTSNEEKDATKYFLEGNIDFKWTFTQSHFFSMNYDYATTSISGLTDVSSDYLLLDRNSLQRGLGFMDFLNQSSFIVSYYIGGPTRRMSFDTGVVFSKQHDFITSKQTITQNYQISELVLVKNQSSTSFWSTSGYYLKKIFTNIKLKLNYSYSDYYFFVESEKNTYKSNNYGMGVEIRTSAFDHLDVVVGINFQTPDVSVNGMTRPTVYASSQFIDLVYKPNRSMTFKTVIDRSAYNRDNTQQDFWFINLNYDYIIMRNKLTIGLEFVNLLDQNTIKSVNVSRLGTTTSEYRIQPRTGLFKLDYRF